MVNAQLVKRLPPRNRRFDFSYKEIFDMNRINSAITNALIARIEEVEKIDSTAEISGISAIMISSTEDLYPIFYMPTKQIEIRKKELEVIQDPKILEYTAELKILIENFISGLDQIVTTAENEKIIIDENKFMRYFLQKDTDFKTGMTEFLNSTLKDFVSAIYKQ